MPVTQNVQHSLKSREDLLFSFVNIAPRGLNGLSEHEFEPFSQKKTKQKNPEFLPSMVKYD